MFKHKQDFKLFQLESKSLEKQKLKFEDKDINKRLAMDRLLIILGY